MTAEERRTAHALTRALCRRYALGIFDAAAVPVREAGGVRARRVHWALGWLADDECELLGAWTDHPGGLPRRLADLKRRGVERLSTVVAPYAVHTQGGVRAELSDSVAYPVVDEAHLGGRVAAWARILPSAQAAAGRVHAAVARAVRRHGRFESEQAGLDFVGAVLQRAERRLDRERSIAADGPRQAPAVRELPAAL